MYVHWFTVEVVLVPAHTQATAKAICYPGHTTNIPSQRPFFWVICERVSMTALRTSPFFFSESQ